MLRYRKLLLFLSVIFSIVTAYFGYRLINELSTENPTTYITIPIAKVDIEPLTEITANSLTYIQVEEVTVSNLSIIIDENQLLGEMTATKIEKNSPFLNSQLYDVTSNNPFHLKPGYRAITIENTPLIGVGDHLKPNMFVDIIWVYVDGRSNAAKSIVAFQNIQVLAIGPPMQEETSISTSSISTITLMMELSDTNKLALLEKTGSFKLVLRSSKLDPTIEIEPIYLYSYLKNK